MRHCTFLCIDLKSFYASVECAERGLDCMTAKLVVADPERKEGTICLAVSPALKALGVKNRCRVYEIPKNIDYIMAPPRMQLYIDYSAEIYSIYLEFFSPEDVYVYSVDEAFMDATHYLDHYKKTPRELAQTIMGVIEKRLKIRATCGIGTNLYLTKIALDMVSKHAPDFIGELDEESYRKKLWLHQPLTDFWRIGPGIQRRLYKNGLHTMKDIALAPEDWIYSLFGIDGELLIDHAWGREPVTMQDLKAYRPRAKSLSLGQTLPRNYTYEEGKLVVREMVDELCLSMVKKGLKTSSVTFYAGYAGEERGEGDAGTVSFPEALNGDRLMIPAILELYEKIVDSSRQLRVLSFHCGKMEKEDGVRQMNIFDYEDMAYERDRNRKLQRAVLEIQSRYGKDAMMRGMDLEKAAMTRIRNHQIGGHRSGT